MSNYLGVRVPRITYAILDYLRITYAILDYLGRACLKLPTRSWITWGARASNYRAYLELPEVRALRITSNYPRVP